MTAQYDFIVSCKRITKARWVLEMQSEQGDIPMSIVQPESNVSGVLTRDTVVQEIPDPTIMTRYLRQLNRRTSSRSGGHNDSVIWNISQRFPHLRVGQQLAVRISYFEHRALSDMRSCTYEIKSLGVFPRLFHRQEGHAKVPPQAAHPPPSATQIRSVSKPAPDQFHTQEVRIPQIVIDTIAHLVNYVENLEQQLQNNHRTLDAHDALLRVVQERMKTVEERVQQLEAENRKLKEMIHKTEATHPEPASPHADASTSTPSASRTDKM